VHTLRHAAELLRSAISHEGRLAIARLLGFDGEETILDAASRTRFGLPHTIGHCSLLAGRGSLRVLLIDADAEQNPRELLTQIAIALHARSSHVLWLIIAATHEGKTISIGTWYPVERGRRVVALVTQRANVVASDAEALLALAAVGDSEDLLIHARWCELLGRDAMSRRFFHLLAARVRRLGDSLTGIPRSDRSELALLYTSRLLFLSFLQTKGWLDADHAYLSRRFDQCMISGGHFHQRVLLPLFFGTLNTRISHRAPVARTLGKIPFLNGGLFSRTAPEKRHRHARFSDDALGALFSDVLGAFRFTARETADEWMEASIDPEMLGQAFESLMAGHERKASGTFYTPHELVQNVTESALTLALATPGLPEECIAGALRGESLPRSRADLLRSSLSRFTVLDPACGSGSFLVHVLEQVSSLQRNAGDERDIATIRRELLGRAIHGVDINPTAVWLCELRLWLSVVIESPETRVAHIPPLPNLDCNIRVGDALAGSAFTSPPTLMGPPAALARLHSRYVRATGPGKVSLRKALHREERRRALALIDRELSAFAELRRERARARRARDLFGQKGQPTAGDREFVRATRARTLALRRERQRLADGGALPFSFPSHFGAVHARGGFRLIIGNPPWVRIHNIPAAQRAVLRERYSVYRNAAWQPDDSPRQMKRGFASQVDMASLFVERSADLVADGGCLALLVPSKLWHSLSGGGLRHLIGTRLHLRALEDWTAAAQTFDAAVYPSVLLAQRASQAQMSTVQAVVRRGTFTARWSAREEDMRLDPFDAASPLILLPPAARDAFNLMAARGTPLSKALLGRLTLGVKCGHNDAFILHSHDDSGDLVDVEQHGRSGRVEHDLVRPLLRGESVTPWSIERSAEGILWTHDATGRPLPALPRMAAQWLAPWRQQLLNRTDLHSDRRWWSLFRVDGAHSLTTRVVWSDFGRRPRAAILQAGDRTVPLNTCYVLSCDCPEDAYALCAVLNSPLAAAWLNCIAEPARGGWYRYLAWTVSLLPLPLQWAHVRNDLARITSDALLGQVPSDHELLNRVSRAYGFVINELEMLLQWSSIPSNC
jgi:hypothetical protein